MYATKQVYTSDITTGPKDDPYTVRNAITLNIQINSPDFDQGEVCKGQERETDFINVVAWHHTADFICRYFGKGSMIAIEGSIQTRKYQDRNGNNRVAVEVVANQASFCGSKNEGANTRQQEPSNPLDVDTDDDFEDLPDDDMLPFNGGGL